ncbi:MAG: FAD-binding and (Fe-S)-binding domain-containing protein, partial [Phycisphaerae bacterium]
VLATVAAEQADEIAARFPKVMRSNAGYGLDRLRHRGGRINPEAVVCGSEGTLGVVVGATLNLVPLPKRQGLVVVCFEELLASLEATPAILEHEPAAVELIDSHIIDAARSQNALPGKGPIIDGSPQAVLIVELFDEDEGSLRRRLEALMADLQARSLGYVHRLVLEPDEQAKVWEMRRAGLGLLMSRPGDRQPHAFVEDTCVDPARLAEYIGRFQQVLREEGCERAGYYAHASVGVIHARPALNLKDGVDLGKMRRIADRISSLVLEFGGTPTGEHGDGILRSGLLSKVYGPNIIEAFARIKHTFDPQGIFNPGKIVNPLPAMQDLRYGEGFAGSCQLTTLDFSRHGGMAGLAGMCSGVGQCRQRLVGTMCPSYMATGDERHTTRARANALRMALSNRGILSGLADPVLDEVMDLCVSCKACKTECPTGTDLAKLKAEWLSARHRRLGVPRRSRLVADAPEWAMWGSRFAPLSNWLLRSAAVRGVMERRFGLDRRMMPPRFVRKTFRRGFARYRKRSEPARPDQPRVVYFVDTWTDHHTPEVGWAVVKVLEALGYRVLVAQTRCCGRPMISQGLLGEAKLLAKQNVESLVGFATRGMPIVVSEPSCLSALIDDWPALVQSNQARVVARQAVSIEGFVARELARGEDRLTFTKPTSPIVYHGHCHQKALWGTESAMAVLEACTQDRATLIPSGCCGMAGAFGHEVEHHEVARAIGEDRLFPAIRERRQAEVVVSGFSCRQQVEHHTGVRARHPVEVLAESLG